MIDHSISRANSQELSSVSSISKHSNSVKLGNVIEISQVSQVAEMIDIISRTEKRIQYEVEIMKILGYYLKKLDSTLGFIPFGSSTYGFGGSKTNFNILVNAGKKNIHCIIIVTNILVIILVYFSCIKANGYNITGQF